MDLSESFSELFLIGERSANLALSKAFHESLILKAIRESLNLKPGQKVKAFQYEGRIELVPLIPIRQARGMLQGIDTSIEREPDRL